MRTRISGVSLASIEGSVHVALSKYQLSTDGRIEFDLDKASRLELSPDKPNAARSKTPIKYLGNVAGSFFTIAFRPGDGTGDESLLHLSEVTTGRFPRHPKVLPRSKADADSEAHFTLATFLVDEPNADPVLFAGNQTLIGLREGTRLIRLGEIGQPVSEFQRIMSGNRNADPTVTLTTGYCGELRYGTTSDRFGDPHAVYNPHPEYVQLCGFVALSADTAARDLGMLQELGAVEPIFQTA